jgi:16S rRNA processing protein RimM
LRHKGSEKSYKIKEFLHQGTGLLVKFNGIESPEDAKKIIGAELLVEREKAAPLKTDEFYIEDLKGISVLLENNKIIGEISDIIEGGGTFLAEICLNSKEKRLVPFRNEFFGEISIEKKTIILLNDWILE